jgi:hypothetical protein
MFDSNTLPAWGSHVDGAAALVKIRGHMELTSPLSRSLFSFVRKNVVSRCPSCQELPSLTFPTIGFKQYPDISAG